MAGWVGASAEANYSKTSENFTKDTTGKREALLSDYWKTAFGNASGNLNPFGYTPDQQTGVDWARMNLATNPVGGATANANTFLDNANQSVGNVATSFNKYINAAPRQLGQATLSENAPMVQARQGSDFASSYYDPFLKQVVNSSVDDYNTSADRALNQMRVGQAASGAYGGDRGAVAEGQFRGDVTRGLGSLVSNLYSQGFNTAQGFGQSDANRFLTADTVNASNILSNNQYNTGLLDSRDKFNVDAGYRGDQQSMGALSAQGETILKQAGLSQQQLDNVITANGINMDAAQSLFTAGQISQAQLNQLLQLAAAANGQTYDETSTGSGSSTTAGGKASAKFGI